MNKLLSILLMISFIFILSSCTNDFKVSLGEEKDEPVLALVKEDAINDLKDLQELINFEVEKDIDKINRIFNKSFISINLAEKQKDVLIIKEQTIKEAYNLIPLANGEYHNQGIYNECDLRITRLLNGYYYRTHFGGIPLTNVVLMNINGLTQELWDYFFSENGAYDYSVIFNRPFEYGEDPWVVNPIMNNDYFLKGLSYAIDNAPFEERFSDVGISLWGVSYKDYRHLKYDKNIARIYFKAALNDLIEAGYYVVDNIKKPIEINLVFRGRGDNIIYQPIKENIESAFNVDEVTDGKFILNIKIHLDDSPDNLLGGRFDLGFCRISGPYGYKFLYSITNSTTYQISHCYCMSWRVNTNDVLTDCIVFDGYRYSFDAFLSMILWETFIVDGQLDVNRTNFDFDSIRANAPSSGC